MKTNPDAQGILYVVATPLGNPEDITFRAIRILKQVDLIAAEDTRTTARLLRHYGIKTPQTSYFEHNEPRKAETLLARLKEGKTIALVSEAGTPGISDPGFRLIRLAIRDQIPVKPIPGPSALLAALSVSGLPTDSFLFLGFLPNRATRRRKAIERWREWDRTLVLYESPHRLVATLKDLLEILGDREIAVARELTKSFEEVLRGTIGDVLEEFNRRRVKGEFTLVVAGTERRKKPLTRTSTGK
ncbi:MAG: 16S rRNA (cytidine(1402)-2'-O)-methyltransferase [Deltaproteobacteria bacterium]|nr:16S rRNA (cytidine(1402)-2'-O)-methyltransferase [Deltaproteobacteria bacterium]